MNVIAIPGGKPVSEPMMVLYTDAYVRHSVSINLQSLAMYIMAELFHRGRFFIPQYFQQILDTACVKKGFTGYILWIPSPGYYK